MRERCEKGFLFYGPFYEDLTLTCAIPNSCTRSLNLLDGSHRFWKSSP